MDRRLRVGFTLVEIMIVVVILGILSLAVVPVVAQASTDAVKSQLDRQLQTIAHQIEVYRTSHQGRLPTADPADPMGAGGSNGGWGVLVSSEHLPEAPMNAFTGSSLLEEGDFATASSALMSSGVGWYMQAGVSGLDVFAAGYDPMTRTLSNE